MSVEFQFKRFCGGLGRRGGVSVLLLLLSSPLLGLALVLSLGFSGGVANAATTMILVHGYQSSPAVWYESGVATQLQRAGWRDDGVLSNQRGMVRWMGPNPHPQADDKLGRFVTVALPDESPIGVQSHWLASYVQTVKQRYPKDAIALVGHSAGAVVARLMMVRHVELGVSTLVSIAAPNHGAAIAGLGRAISDSPLGMVAPFMGLGTVNRSRGLYEDFNINSGYSAIRWLNVQPHPAARYVAVIHENPQGSQIVAPASQSLMGIAGLRQPIEVYPMRSGHSLGRLDGELVAFVMRGK